MGRPLVNNYVLSDNATNAFVSSLQQLPIVYERECLDQRQSNGDRHAGARDPFANQNISGFVGDQFPLANGVTVSTGTALRSPANMPSVLRIFWE